MTRFTDGPAAGKFLGLARNPLFLRVTVASREGGSEFDALDGIRDKPEPSEAVHVYRKTSDDGSVHYCGRGKDGKRFSRWERNATYALYANQPDDATVRDTAAWRAWCQSEVAKETTPPAPEEATGAKSAGR